MDKRLVSVLANVFGLSGDQIAAELTRENIGNWDSLKQMDLVVSLEREFNLALEISDIVRMTSIRDIIDVLTNKGITLES